MCTGAPAPKSGMHSPKMLCARECSLKAHITAGATASSCTGTPWSSDGNALLVRVERGLLKVTPLEM